MRRRPSAVLAAEDKQRLEDTAAYLADPRVRERVARESQDLPTLYAGALWASERWAKRRSPALAARIRATRERLVRAFGLCARAWPAPSSAGSCSPRCAREERRLARGATHEPRTFYEANPAAWPETLARGAALCRWVEADGAESEAGAEAGFAVAR